MGKRYRSMAKGMVIGDGRGGTLRFVNHRYPPQGQPPCTDRIIMNHIEHLPKFGKKVWIEEGSGDDVLVAPQPPHVDCDTAHLERAARELERLGLNVNPKFLAGEIGPGDAVEPPEEPEPVDLPVPPTKAQVKKASKAVLKDIIAEWEWDIPTDGTNKEMREAIFERLDQMA